jgi:glycosyltransferase involved in cell wall biosynthesis
VNEHRPSPIDVERPTIWVDVADFLEFFRYLERPTGIQRVEMEMLTELARIERRSGTIRFCRLDESADRFEAVELETLARVFHDPPVPAGSPHRRLRRFLRRLLRAKRLAYWRPAPIGPRTDSFRRGDILVCLGTSWENPRYIGLLRRARELGVRIVVLIHDIIPVACPGFVEAGLLRRFEPWLEGVLSNSDLVLANSRHSRAALLDHAARRRLAIPPVEVLRFGTGFPALGAPDGPTGAAFPEPFVLYVSTIEVRKNHALLLRVWRRLIEQHGAAAVPSLLLIGRMGWLVDDLMAEFSRAGALRDKVVIASGLSDAEVAMAYRHCLFTVFPSLMEGWGLPVEESLTQGKLCVASDRGAIPEVGGDLVDYFDAADDDGAFAAISRAIFDPEYRGAREAQIRNEFRPQSWTDCVATLIGHLERLSDGADPRAVPTIATTGARDVV